MSTELSIAVSQGLYDEIEFVASEAWSKIEEKIEVTFKGGRVNLRGSPAMLAEAIDCLATVAGLAADNGKPHAQAWKAQIARLSSYVGQHADTHDVVGRLNSTRQYLDLGLL